jgi:hypothetical protein
MFYIIFQYLLKFFFYLRILKSYICLDEKMYLLSQDTIFGEYSYTK